MAVEGWPLVEVVQRSRLPLLLTDPSLADNPIIFANPAFLQLSGYDLDEVLGRNCRFLQGPKTDPEAVQRIRKAVSHGTDIHLELLNYRKDGSAFWNDLFVAPLSDEGGRLVYFLGCQLDVTDRIQAHDAVRQVRDELAEKLLEREVQHWVRNNLQLLLTLVRIEAGADPATAPPWHEVMSRRILALAAAHAPLGHDGDFASVDLGTTLARLVSLIASDVTRVAIDVERMSGNIDTVISIVLMVGEMLTATPPGDVELSLRRVPAQNSVMLQVSPQRRTGSDASQQGWTGLPVTLSETEFRVLRTLADQLNGTLLQEDRKLAVVLPDGLFRVSDAIQPD